MHNPLDPALMSPAARRAEVAAILATGFLRLRLRHVDGRHEGPDALRPPSEECLEWLGLRPPRRPA